MADDDDVEALLEAPYKKEVCHNTYNGSMCCNVVV